jgi:hypothetical protein
LAGLAIIGGIFAGHSGTDASGAVRIVPDSDVVIATAEKPTAEWLADIRRELAIGPDQAPAWRNYVDAMTELERSRIELDRRRATGAVRDIETERARHAMMLAAALAELERYLSPEHQTKARLLTQILAETVICREQAVR